MILVINGGSSSLKYAVFDGVARRAGGLVERVRDFGDATREMLRRLEGAEVTAIGHRVVLGGELAAPARVDDALLARLKELAPLDPQHLPFEIALIEALRAELPSAPQVACFDSAFHRTMPEVARTLPIPRRLGLRRFGFHGLSYESIVRQLEPIPAAFKRRVIVLHLGSGASVCALKDGVSVDTSMGMTPNAGIPMGTRSGDLDAGLLLHLARNEGVEALDRMLSKESGLFGMSELSADVRDLSASDDPRARLALDVFCYAAKKQIGAYAAALGGLDGIVFTAGIGERGAHVRERVLSGLEFLGVVIDPQKNEHNEEVISISERPWVRVLHTDEEGVIARAVISLTRSPTRTP